MLKTEPITVMYWGYCGYFTLIIAQEYKIYY